MQDRPNLKVDNQRRWNNAGLLRRADDVLRPQVDPEKIGKVKEAIRQIGRRVLIMIMMRHWSGALP